MFCSSAVAVFSSLTVVTGPRVNTKLLKICAPIVLKRRASIRWDSCSRTPGPPSLDHRPPLLHTECPRTKAQLCCSPRPGRLQSRRSSCWRTSCMMTKRQNFNCSKNIDFVTGRLTGVRMINFLPFLHLPFLPVHLGP